MEGVDYDLVVVDLGQTIINTFGKVKSWSVPSGIACSIGTGCGGGAASISGPGWAVPCEFSTGGPVGISAIAGSSN